MTRALLSEVKQCKQRLKEERDAEAKAAAVNEKRAENLTAMMQKQRQLL